MPAPIAKGIIIGVSVIVAAGIAVYESPQFRQWVNNSRRKLAAALHNLGDEIQPRESVLQDISMTEDPGAAAAERRQKAREELSQRRAFMESRLRTQSSDSSIAVSFDSLVDNEGRLRSETADRSGTVAVAQSTALSTALETSDMGLIQRRGDLVASEPLTEDRLQAQREMMEVMEHDRLRLAVVSEASSHHPSESLVDLTPTSEFPETDLRVSTGSINSSHDQASRSEYFPIESPIRSPNHLEAEGSGYYYAHPSEPTVPSSGTSHTTNPFRDYDLSTASSVPGSLSHVHDEASSDGTMSEWGQPTDGVATPASWSEIGSVVSSDDGHHQ
ncbi:hypothetical protein BGW36DRAFT_376019 [Talaromyces proteolyticus]|uniref:Uncharacterized protein n=1 Tax=Talaromyces proteolyticus TaxID=1131652 RepID=A0AAD4KU03_9EURO|nr:uncharacterized protein BGW36DRAFT_376019 [Talaromyces proteolyticus]KAH8698409.1 hypothetical protein BGW36DRAFT_376019 [Talaromyces proteolyticus]